MKKLIIAIAVLSFSAIAFANDEAHTDAKPAQTKEESKTVTKKKKEAAHGKKHAEEKGEHHEEKAAH